MEHHKSIFLLLVAALFLSGSTKQSRNSGDLSAGILVSADPAIYDVKFSFTGYQSFWEKLRRNVK